MPHSNPPFVNLRPHHLLCMLTYIGKGYSESFVKNFDEIASRMSQNLACGECHIHIVDGPDDVCAPRLCDPADTKCHCHDQDIADRDRMALNDVAGILDIGPLEIGSTLALSPALLKELRARFKQDTIRTACRNCQWSELCTDIAATDFAQGKLK